MLSLLPYLHFCTLNKLYSWNKTLIHTLTELAYFPSAVTSPDIFSMFSLGILTLWNMANLFKQIHKQCKIYCDIVAGAYLIEKKVTTKTWLHNSF